MPKLHDDRMPKKNPTYLASQIFETLICALVFIPLILAAVFIAGGYLLFCLKVLFKCFWMGWTWNPL